jgi:hypothetical protein
MVKAKKGASKMLEGWSEGLGEIFSMEEQQKELSRREYF